MPPSGTAGAAIATPRNSVPEIAAQISGGLLPDGVLTYVDEDGNIQRIPYTGTAPWGEATEAGFYEEPPYPNTDYGTTDTEFLDDQIHGTPWRGYEIEEWVNPSNPGVPNLGPVNVQPNLSARSSIVLHYPSDEQGWGMDQAVILPRYPHSENTNPFYALGTYRRNGGLEWNSAGTPLVSNQGWQLQYVAGRRRGTHNRLVDNPQAPSFNSTVQPLGSPLSLVPAGDEAIYE